MKNSTSIHFGNLDKTGGVLSTRVHTFTPSEAIKILEAGGGKNRDIRGRVVNQIAEALLNGTYRLNGESIILCRGAVLDGQHRLTACVQSGVPLTSLVVEVSDPSLFKTIDIGQSRLGSDMVTILASGRGPMPCSSATAISAAARFLMQTDNNGVYTEIASHKRISPTDIASWLEQNQDLFDCLDEMREVVGKSRNYPVTRSIALTIWYLTRDGFPNGLRDFWVPLGTGSGLREGSPILSLRNKGLARSIPGDMITQRQKYAIAAKAWNAHVRGVDVGALRWHSGEKFPAIIRYST